MRVGGCKRDMEQDDDAVAASTMLMKTNHPEQCTYNSWKTFLNQPLRILVGLWQGPMPSLYTPKA